MPLALDGYLLIGEGKVIVGSLTNSSFLPSGLIELFNHLDELILPSIGFLRSILPWDCLVTLVRERDMLITQGRLEVLGLLGGSISGEVDH